MVLAIIQLRLPGRAPHLSTLLLFELSPRPICLKSDIILNTNNFCCRLIRRPPLKEHCNLWQAKHMIKMDIFYNDWLI